MNLRDRIIAYMSPQRVAKDMAARKMIQYLESRAFGLQNTGYSEGGAATGKRWVRGWKWRGGSVREDQEVNLSTLVQRSRDLDMNCSLAAAVHNRRAVNVVGPGLRMRSTPDAELLGLTPDTATAWARKREREFMLWALSRDCEATGLNNYFETQELAYLSWLINGDCIVLRGMETSPNQPYELRLQLIESDRVSNPSGKDRDPQFHNGVETDASGRVVAYHIRSNHPLGRGVESANPNWTRVPVRGDNGRLNVLHLIACRRSNQYRGVPLLSTVIRDIKQYSRYGDAELDAAVLTAFLAVLIKSETPETVIGDTGYAPNVATPDSDGTPKQESPPEEPFEFPIGSASMIALNKGESAEMINPNRPNVNFDNFRQSIAQAIGAATDIPVELLMLKFTSTYTAARGALLEFWKRANIDRTKFSAAFDAPNAQEILEEGLLKGRIEAPGYWDDPAIREAWLAAQWNGPSMGQMNPKEEVTAAQMRVDGGFSTHARESIQISGMDFDDIIQEQTVERKRLIEAGIKEDPNAGAPASNPLPQPWQPLK